MARTSPPPRNRTYRFLLDQNFPEAPIEIARLDATIELVHLRAFDATLTQPRTPDWYIYLRAAEAGFQALVTRDWHQVEQPEELWVLENLALSVVSWRDGVEDSIVSNQPAPALDAAFPFTRLISHGRTACRPRLHRRGLTVSQRSFASR